MHISEIKANTLVIPLAKPTGMSTRLVTERHYTIVQIRSHDGIVGRGFCYSGNKAGHLVTLAVRDLLRQVVIGRDSTQVEQIWEAMFRETILQGRQGLIMRAMSAIDIALWDTNSQAARLPLWKYLGGHHDSSVPAYVSGGYYTDGKTPTDLGREVENYVKMGFRAVKIKVGGLPAEEDALRIEAARKAIGPNILLFLDANNRWNDLLSAQRSIRIWEEWEPDWIEEPFLPDEIDLYCMLAQSIRTPIATGEIESGRWRFKQLIEKSAATILQPDAAVCGGITEWRKIAGLAQSYGVSLSPHWFDELHAHLVAATPNAHWVEYLPDTSILNLRVCFKTQPKLADGRIVLTQEPGLGIEWDERMLEKYSVDGWQ